MVNSLSNSYGDRYNYRPATAEEAIKALKAKQDEISGKTKPADAEATGEKNAQTATQDQAKAAPERPRFNANLYTPQKLLNAQMEPLVKNTLNNGFDNLLKSMFPGMGGTDLNSLAQKSGANMSSMRMTYELNYQAISSMTSINGEDGSTSFSSQSTQFSFKMEISYIEASYGGKVDNPFASSGSKSPNDLMEKLKDYFSPEKTAARIVDFAASFFPNSKQFKEGGDTEEARNSFAEIMKSAIGKGFEQARSLLGKMPQAVEDGVKKTEDLTTKGIEDFIKNGLSNDKQNVYSSLQQYSVSIQASYSSTSVTYTQDGEKQAAPAPDAAAPTIDAQA